MQPPSNGGPHHANDTRSFPCEIHGRPLGGSGVLSTATDAAATSQLCRFITSTVYFPLWSAWMFVNSSIDDPLPTFIWISSLSVSMWPFSFQYQFKKFNKSIDLEEKKTFHRIKLKHWQKLQQHQLRIIEFNSILINWITNETEIETATETTKQIETSVVVGAVAVVVIWWLSFCNCTSFWWLWGFIGNVKCH